MAGYSSDRRPALITGGRKAARSSRSGGKRSLGPRRGSNSGAGFAIRRAGFAAVAAGLVLVGAALLKASSADPAETRVFLRPAADGGAGSFTPSTVDDSVPVEAASGREVPEGEEGQLGGDTPGLYAAARDRSSCRVDELIGFLQSGSERAGAWAAASGVALSDIADYVATLTPVLIRGDTWVSEFRYVEQSAERRQAVLESGTAVLVDRTGIARVRCRSGAILDRPVSFTGEPDFAGKRWKEFDPAEILQVVPAADPRGWFSVMSVAGAGNFGRLATSTVVVDFNSPLGPAPTVLQAGQQMKAEGSGWPPDTALQVHFDDPPELLASPTTGPGGDFSIEVTIPGDSTVGAHTLTITGQGATVNQPFYVIPRAVRAIRS